MIRRKFRASSVRNFFFGVEDGLVSTVGFLSGVAAAGVDRGTIFLTGVVLILVEAFSMAAGSFISEYSAEEYAEKKELPIRNPLRDGAIMFFSYLLAGLVPLFPYLILPMVSGFWLSVFLSLAALATLGIIGARISGVKMSRNILRILTVGGAAIVIGIIVGRAFALNF